MYYIITIKLIQGASKVKFTFHGRFKSLKLSFFLPDTVALLSSLDPPTGASHNSFVN